jgi:hypothetical protein
MTAAFLFFTIVVILGFLGWQLHEARQERLQLVNRIIGQTPGAVRVLDSRPVEQQSLPPMTPEEREFWEHGEPIGGLA